MLDGVKVADICVSFGIRSLSIGLREAPPILAFELPKAVSTRDSTWYKEGSTLQITLMKVRDEIWPDDALEFGVIAG